MSVADEIIADNFVNHGILPAREIMRGREAAKQYMAMRHSAFPDTHFTIEDQIAEGDKVTTRWTATGVHQGEFAGIPATGKRVNFMAINIHRVVDGQIQEGWLEWDALGMMQQLGVITA